SRPPAQWRSSEAFITFVVSFAIFTDLLLYGLLVPVMPTALHERVGLPKGEEQRWTSILLALCGAGQLACAPIAGYLADLISSRKWPLITGLLFLAGSCFLLCIGTTLGLWIAGRLLQGASAAVVWAVGCALLVDSVDRKRLGQALGYLGMAMMMGPLLGPLLGGVVYASGGYYAVFALAFGLVVVDIGLRLVMIERQEKEEEEEEEGQTGDGPDGDSRGRDTRDVVDGSVPASEDSPLLGQQPASQSLSSQSEGYKTPDRPPALFVLLSSERMWITIWGYFVGAVIMSSFNSILPLFVRDTFNWTQTGQGLIFLPLSIPNFLGPFYGWVNDRYPQSRRYVAAGSLLGVSITAVLLRFISEDTTGQQVLLCVLLALLGLSLAASDPPLLSEAAFAVSEQQERRPGIFGGSEPTALMYGILSATFSAGAIAGSFLAGLIKEAYGWSTVTWVIGLVAGVSVFPMLLCVGGL
ncbi:hypothetical protein ASPSYDRAFT_125924, partial [Aspergillus sydowii CBS 593.65]